MSHHDHRIRLQAATQGDAEFMREVFTAIHGTRFLPVGLQEPQLTNLLELQFQAQQAQYRTSFPEAQIDLIFVDEVPVGYWIVDRGPDAYTLVDIALHPVHSGRGTGSHVTRRLIREARMAGKSVRAHVERQNRAWHLWQRLGFRITGDDGVYLAIEYAAADPGENQRSPS